MIETGISSSENLRDTAFVDGNYMKLDIKLETEFTVEILTKGNLAYLPFHEKSAQSYNRQILFSLSVITVFKNTYFGDNMTSIYMPTSSSGAHLLCLKIRRESGSLLISSEAFTLKLSKNHFVSVIFHLLTVSGIFPSMWLCYSPFLKGAWQICVVCLLMYCPKAIIK